MMHASAIDFARSARHLRISGWPLLAAAIVAAVTVASWWNEARSESEAIEATVRHAARAAPAPQVDALLEQQVRTANEAIDQIALPWNHVFGAVEGATLEGVTLLGISPDARNGTLLLRAEATGADLMFEYARRLAEQPGLTGVFLVDHRMDPGTSSRPLQFTLTASWLEPAP